MLATYVHDMGGGLVMIGGEESFGAGGWGGSKLEEVLPVNMDIPAQRQMPKGALVMVMHSCEMPHGNYWGEQCALKAAKTLSSRDEIGVISYAWAGAGGGGSQWDFPLAGKRRRLKASSPRSKRCSSATCPSFDDMLDVALHGGNQGQQRIDRFRCAAEAHHHHLRRRSAACRRRSSSGMQRQQDHRLDGHRLHAHAWHAQPADGTDGQAHARPGVWADREQSESASADFHQGSDGRSAKPDLTTDKQGYSGQIHPERRSDIAKGLEYGTPPVTGLVLTSKKPNPQVDDAADRRAAMAIRCWRTGRRGWANRWRSRATRITDWAAQWVSSQMYDKFWSQVVRAVARPPMSNDLEATMSVEGNKAKIVVEALNKDASFLNFMNVSASVVGAGCEQAPSRCGSCRPGRDDMKRRSMPMIRGRMSR